MVKNRIRYRQRDFHLKELDNIENIDWSIEKYGCGPTSIATILANFGYNISPIDVAKKILFDHNNNFDKTYLRKKGINENGLIYSLDRFINEDKFNLIYKIVKIDFTNPIAYKKKIIKMFKDGYMAVIHVGPSEVSPSVFSKNGHYLVISDVDEEDNFYCINSNKIGDSQVGVPFDYDTIIKSIYGRKDSFNFLFIKRM